MAGIASIATIALLLNELAFPSAGVMAAFLSALHPWHIRYASKARAYAFVLCLIPFVIYFFLRALENGLWRWWAAFGTAEFLQDIPIPRAFILAYVKGTPGQVSRPKVPAHGPQERPATG